LFSVTNDSWTLRTDIARNIENIHKEGGLGPNPATQVASILDITIAEAEYLLDTCCDCNPSNTGVTTPIGWPVGVDCD
jgi:hypothetical protein